MFLLFLGACINEGHFGIEMIHFLCIELNSIRFGGNLSCELASYRETTSHVPGTYCQHYFRSEYRRISRITRLTTEDQRPNGKGGP